MPLAHSLAAVPTVVRPLAWALLMTLVCTGPVQAQGQCAAAASADISFGGGTSFDVQATAHSAVANAVASCSGGLLNALVLLGDPPYLRATIVGSGNNSQLMNGSDAIPYAVYADPTRQFALTPGVAFNYYQQTLLNILGLLGGTSGNIPMYLRTAVGANVAAGTYTDTFTVNWSWRICNVGVVVCLGYAQGSATTTVTVTLTVTAACQITSAPDVGFGQAPVLSAFPVVSHSIGVLCTKGLASYSVGLGGGLHPDGSGRRQMASGGNRLQYDIFQGVSAVVWGLVGGGRVTSPGAADGVTSRAFPYTARIYLDQAAPALGHYSDSVVIDVVF